ncbi:hypothetical protein [Streptomyces sp. MAI_2237]
MRKVLVGLATLAAVCGAAVPAGAVVTGGPEADLAYHGAVSMADGTVGVRFTPLNNGPSAAPDVTVRLRWSAALADRQELPEGCVRSGPRVVLCRVGELPADGLGERIALRVRLRAAPSEVLLVLDTVWSGGTVDPNRRNDRQRVLVLDTGDEYYF